MYFNRTGEPIAVEEWARLWANWEYRCLADQPVGPYRIATIWLGIDESYGMGDRRILFETTPFQGSKPLEQLTCSTEAEALRQHTALVSKYWLRTG